MNATKSEADSSSPKSALASAVKALEEKDELMREIEQRGFTTPNDTAYWMVRKVRAAFAIAIQPSAKGTSGEQGGE